MQFDAGTWWLVGVLLTFLIGALGWMVKRSLDKIERKLDNAATKAEFEKEIGEWAGTGICQRCAGKGERFACWDRGHARPMAVCAIADAMYAYAQLEAGNGAVQSVSIGSVSENRAAVPAPDTSPAARAAEYYRCVQLYATIYRGC